MINILEGKYTETNQELKSGKKSQAWLLYEGDLRRRIASLRPGWIHGEILSQKKEEKVGRIRKRTKSKDNMQQVMECPPHNSRDKSFNSTSTCTQLASYTFFRIFHNLPKPQNLHLQLEQEK
jgi:hypothetical protein